MDHLDPTVMAREFFEVRERLRVSKGRISADEMQYWKDLGEEEQLLWVQSCRILIEDIESGNLGR